MPRTIIDLPEPLMREVDALCRTLGISRAEAVRRSLSAFVDEHHDVRADGFGLWKQAANDPVGHDRRR